MIAGSPPAHNDPHRPRFHFQPSANWMNDPNGLIRWNGQFHLFYQHNPHGPAWGTIHWGHATSRDLVHWQHEPLALAPTPGSADADGCWSGCAVNDNGVPTLIYTGVRGERQLPCLATGDSTLRHWAKHAANPLLEPPPGLDLVAFRDPSVWREGDEWHMLVGAGIRGVGGAALLYTSPDLRTWAYRGPILVGSMRRDHAAWGGTLWECPQLLRFGERRVLMVAAWHQRPLASLAMVGTYTDGQFTPRRAQKLDFGDDYFYAPQALADPDGRTLLWGWVPEGRSLASQCAAGWAGLMSLPRVLWLAADGTLAQAPAPELEALRGRHQKLTKAEALESIHGDCMELALDLDPHGLDQCSIALRCSPDGAEQTYVIYDHARGWLGIDTSRASLSADTLRDVRGGAFHVRAGERLRLRIFLDRSVVEVFANDRACVTSRIYPTRADSTGVAFSAHGATPALNLDVWELRSIWE